MLGAEEQSLKPINIIALCIQTSVHGIQNDTTFLDCTCIRIGTNLNLSSDF